MSCRSRGAHCFANLETKSGGSTAAGVPTADGDPEPVNDFETVPIAIY